MIQENLTSMPLQKDGNANASSDEVQVSVVVVCYNKEKELPEFTERIFAMFEKQNVIGEIVLVNNGSKDNTGTVIDSLAARYHAVRGCHHKKQGLEASWRTGVSAAQGKYVCLIDANLQNLPEEVWRLYRHITLTKADMVQGYQRSVKQDSCHRLRQGLNFLLNILFEMRLHSHESGSIIISKETLEDVLRHRFKYHSFQTFIAVAAKAKGYRIEEIESLEHRLLSESVVVPFPVKAILLYLVDLMKALVEYRISPEPEGVLAAYLKTHKPHHSDLKLPLMRRLWFELFIMTMPFHKWMITRRAKLYYNELKQSQWLSSAEIRELQQQKLQRLLRHAYNHVPYYRRRFDTLGITPSDIKTLDDLQKLPLLTKQDVKENLHFDLFSDNHNKQKILKVSTSGSTGEPFICYADQHQLEIRWAATQRSIEWVGVRFGDRQVRLWHQTIGMSKLQILREKLDAWFNRRMFIPAFEMSDANLAKFVEQIKKWNPVFIDGYAESFNFLAHYIKHNKLEGMHLKGIMSSAQVLPEQSRKIIEDSFGCKVFDKYGSREFSGIAYECEAHDGGHHIIGESYIVEILKDGRPAQPGEMGEVVITDLNNFCMPFIRYRLGDLAVAMDNTQTCSCGRGLPRIGQIQGRIQAIIAGANGNYVPGTFFAHLFKDYDDIIRQYQVVQEQPSSMVLMIIKAPGFNERRFAEVLNELHQYLGHEMKIDVQFVDTIPMVRTGKQQGSISRLQFDFQTLELKKIVTLSLSKRSERE